MATTDYYFISKWRVLADVEEVVKIIGDAPSLVRWWPAVYLEVTEINPGDDKGLGKEVSLHTKGWLPYTLNWQLHITELSPRYGFTFETTGDYVGRGIWTFEQDLAWVNITYDWQVQVNKPMLRYFSALLNPIFSADHHWSMAKGEASLNLELARRRAKTAADAAQIPPPPPATTYQPWLVLLGIFALLGLLYRFISRRK